MSIDARPPPKEDWMINPLKALWLHAALAGVALVGGIYITQHGAPNVESPSNQEIADRFKTNDWSITDRQKLRAEASNISSGTTENAAIPKDSVQMLQDSVQMLSKQLTKIDTRLQQLEARQSPQP